MSTPAPGAVRKVADALRSELLTRSNLRLLVGVAAVGTLSLFGGFGPAGSEIPSSGSPSRPIPSRWCSPERTPPAIWSATSSPPSR